MVDVTNFNLSDTYSIWIRDRFVATGKIKVGNAEHVHLPYVTGFEPVADSLVVHDKAKLTVTNIQVLQFRTETVLKSGSELQFVGQQQNINIIVYFNALLKVSKKVRCTIEFPGHH